MSVAVGRVNECLWSFSTFSTTLSTPINFSKTFWLCLVDLENVVVCGSFRIKHIYGEKGDNVRVKWSRARGAKKNLWPPKQK